MTWLGYLLGAIALLLATLKVLRTQDQRREHAAWMGLVEDADNPGRTFDPTLVAELPEPARRFFQFTIQPGTRLANAVEVEMGGEIGLGTRAKPNYRPMRACQLLCPPQGFIWSLRSGAISGSDGATTEASWTHFWLLNIIPVARVGGSDHQRSAFGRLVADSVIWAPASLLPRPGVSWEPLSSDSAQVTVREGSLEQSVTVEVDAEGAPLRVFFQRWSDANPERQYRYQPFGGDLSEFQNFAGYRLATRVLAGNHYGTEDYFPFFKAAVTTIRFPETADR